MIQSSSLILSLWIGLLAVVNTQDIPDGCIQVMMKEEGVCEDKETRECGECQTIQSKDCTIIMKEVVVPMRYKRCGVDRSQTGRCVDGGRRSCSVR